MVHRYFVRQRYATLWLHLVLAVVFPGLLAAQAEWKTFSNRSGWSMNYPADWTIASCHSCSDPAAPDVYVDFFPPKTRADGAVIVEHLQGQPSRTTVDEWFRQVKRTANQNPQLTEERFTLNDLPALRVRYRNRNGGFEMEAVYVVYRGHTFAIEFDGVGQGASLETSENYSTYLKMLKSFRVKG